MTLELIAIDKRFGSRRALERVSLQVAPGEVVAFLGHNGAGKTTAMRIALGLSRPDGGSVRVDGFDALKEAREARARMGGLIETPGFHPRASARAELELLARLGGLAPEAARRAAQDAIARVGLDPSSAQAVGTFSQGMRQRLGLAQALLGAPRYLVLDEPLNGLDPEASVELRHLFARLAREEGVGLLVSSHQLSELSEIATQVVILRQGRVLRAGRMSALLAEQRASYRVRPLDLARAGAALERERVEFQVQGEQLELQLGGREPSALARLLLDAGGGFSAFAPRETTLEQLYLRVQQEAPAAPAAPSAAAVTEPPAERIAPRAPGRSMLRYELTRLWREARPSWCFALPLLVALLALVQRLSQARADESAVAGQRLYSATGVNAFEAFGVMLSAGLPVLALIACGVASQSLAGELGRGTLRNVLLRPVERGQVALGKAWALLTGSALGYAALVLVALGLAGLLLDFGDVSEILPNGTRFPLVTAGELWPQLVHTLGLSLLALAAPCALGFLAGSIASGGAGALGIALGGWVALDLARVFARGSGFEAWLPSAYLPSPLSDTSAVAAYLDLARGISSARFEFAATAPYVPIVWALLSLLAARAILVRRDVP